MENKEAMRCACENIDLLQKRILDCQIAEFDKLLMAFLNSMEYYLGSLEQTNDINKILQSLLHAYEKKDYLLFTDILEFELKRRICAGEGETYE